MNNSQDLSVNGDLNMLLLYNKSPYLKKFLRRDPAAGKLRCGQPKTAQSAPASCPYLTQNASCFFAATYLAAVASNNNTMQQYSFVI